MQNAKIILRNLAITTVMVENGGGLLMLVANFTTEAQRTRRHAEKRNFSLCSSVLSASPCWENAPQRLIDFRSRHPLQQHIARIRDAFSLVEHGMHC